MNRYFALKYTIPGVGLNKNAIIVENENGELSIINGNVTSKDIDYLNVHNKRYFEEITDKFNESAAPKFKVGDNVKVTTGKYVGLKFKIVKVIKEAQYINNRIDNIYTYCLTNDNYKEIIIGQAKLEKIKVYWFVNSEGKICEIEYKGLDRDAWRMLTGNYFATKEDARNYVDKIWNGKCRITVLREFENKH